MEKNNFFKKVAEFLHGVGTKIKMVFKGKNVEFIISVDLTQDIVPQLKGIEHTIASKMPNQEMLNQYLKTA